MRRLLILAAVATTLIGLLAAPAAADRPTPDGPFTDTFPETDPCTGEPMEVTLTTTFFDHLEHKNNFVFRSVVTGSTDVGYVMIGHHETFVGNKGGVRASFKDIWRNPENGNKMQASGSLRIVGNSPVVDTFKLRCVGSPTLP